MIDLNEFMSKMSALKNLSTNMKNLTYQWSLKELRTLGQLVTNGILIAYQRNIETKSSNAEKIMKATP